MGKRKKLPDNVPFVSLLGNTPEEVQKYHPVPLPKSEASNKMEKGTKTPKQPDTNTSQFSLISSYIFSKLNPLRNKPICSLPLKSAASKPEAPEKAARLLHRRPPYFRMKMLLCTYKKYKTENCYSALHS